MMMKKKKKKKKKIIMKIMMMIHGLLRRLSMVNSKALVFLCGMFKVLAKAACSG